MNNILLIEDEKSLYDIIRMNLELEGYQVEVISDGKTAIEKADALHEFDLVILDIMLPKVSGLEICTQFRKKNQIPILILSAKGTASDRVAGLKLGANDYLSKPFDLEELLLRVKNLLTTVPEKTATEITIGNKIVHFKTFEISENKQIVTQLSKREIDLLRLFQQKAGEVVSRDFILEAIWGIEAMSNARTIDNYILNFRKIFEIDAKNPQFFHSIRGVGYKFTP
jgi:two-component system alkaline phosphatase synthesis response regulator PhoP